MVIGVVMAMPVPVLSPAFYALFPPARVKTILVHNKDQPIGDAFIQASFFHALRCLFPEAHITFAVSIGGSAYGGSLRTVMAPYIDEVLADAALCLKREQMYPMTPRPLDGRRFDLVIDMEKKWWRSLAVRRIRSRVFVSAARHFLFSDCWPRSWRKPAHLGDQYHMLLDALRVRRRAAVPPPVWRDEVCESRSRDMLPDGPRYVGLVPGAGDQGKRWPLDRFTALAQSIAAEGGTPVFILGPQERPWLESLRASVSGALFPGEDGGGLTDPLQTVALGRRLAAAVTNDCGTAHMLAAGATPLVALFGYTNPVKYAPRTPELTVIRAHDFGGTTPEVIPLDAVKKALADLCLGTAPAQP